MFRMSAINPGAGRLYTNRIMLSRYGGAAPISAHGPAELCRRRQTRQQRIGHFSIPRRSATSLVEPTAAAIASTTAAAVRDADHDGTAGGFTVRKTEGVAAPAAASAAKTMTVSSTTTKTSTGADALRDRVASAKATDGREDAAGATASGADDAATDDANAAAAAGCAGSATVGRVIGVSEAAAISGGSGGWSKRRCWVVGGAGEGRGRGFVAQHVASPNVEVGIIGRDFLRHTSKYERKSTMV